MTSVNSALVTLERFIHDTKELIRMDACVGETLVHYMDFLYNRLHEESEEMATVRFRKDKLTTMKDKSNFKFLYTDSSPSSPMMLKQIILDAYEEYGNDDAPHDIATFMNKDYAKRAFDACVMLMAQGYNYKVYINMDDATIKEYIIFKDDKEPLLRIFDNGTGQGGFFDLIENYGDLFNTWKVFSTWYRDAGSMRLCDLDN